MTEETDKKFLNEMGEAQTKVDFGIKDALTKKNSTTVSVGGDVLFKDIQLFIPELIVNVALLVFGVLGVVFIRLLSQGWLNESIKPMTSPQAFESIVGHIMFLQNVLVVLFAIPIIYILFLFIFKWYFFYPRGKKNLVIRAWKMGVGRLGFEEIKDNYVVFDGSKDTGDKMHINYSNAGIEYYTGRKIILLQEGLSENTPLHSNLVTNEKVKDRGNVNASMFSAALKFADMQNKKAQGFWNNPTNILVLVAIAIIIVVAFFVITKGSPTEAMNGVVSSMTARSGKV